MNEQDSLTTFKSRIYDLLLNRHKLAPVNRIGALTPEDSTLCAALALAAEKFQEDAALELATAAFEGFAATFLSIYTNGLPEGANMQSPSLQKLAEVLAEAGRNTEGKNAEQGNLAGS